MSELIGRHDSLVDPSYPSGLSESQDSETTALKPFKITEIYASIQGESSYAGLPCVFIRFTGCPLRCKWCDTVYSFEGGETSTMDALIDRVSTYGVNLVELTGGEPLAQEGVPHLIDRLVDQGYRVLIETSGSEPVRGLNRDLHIIMDLKCPDSGMSDRNLWVNLASLKPTDEIKFVVASRADFEWAVATIAEHRLDTRFHVLLSPAFGLLKPAQLAEWMVKETPRCRLNLQQHKYIWHPRAKGV